MVNNNIRNGNAKSERYNWTKDPRKLLIDNRIPVGRCFHCACRFANPSPYSAFCIACWFDMKLDSQEPKPGFWAMQRTHVRLEEDDDKENDDPMVPKFTRGNKI